jgi:predicted Holliday junction resolvase-like endonuclease
MRQFRFRLKTIMIVIAFVALILTVIIQGRLLRRAAVAKQNEMAVPMQNASFNQAVFDQTTATLMQEAEQLTAELAREARELRKRKLTTTLEDQNDELGTATEETTGGFRRWIRELKPRPDQTERQGHEHD